MKLQNLTIHNIASIEDAFINFDAEPLATSEVFLITGKTGAGKSTILDAICLALYATTPRLKNTNMQGESTDGNKEVKIDDPRQLMRRNTGEAFATLQFIGCNGVHYEATWSVSRARNKATGNLQSKKWMLHNLDTGHTLSKDKEIADEINAAVGLEFNQFCRTTMLAQGDFTRFLNSKDKEKAEILEKITGVDIYSKIGKKVFEVTTQKQQIWEEAARLLENTQILSPEDIAKHQATIKAAEEEQQRLTAERDMAEKKRSWLSTATGLAKKICSATETCNEASKKAQSDEFKAKELIVRQWNDTIDARSWQRELQTAGKSGEELQKILEETRQEFAELQSGELWLTAETEKIRNRSAELARAIDGEKDRESVYANAQSICSLLKTMEEGRKKVADEKKSMAKEEARLNGELKLQRKTAQEKAVKIQEHFKAQEEKLKAQEAQLSGAQLHVLRNRKDHYLNLLTATVLAKDKLETLAKAHALHENKKEEIAKQEKHIADLSKQLAALAPQIHDAGLIAKTKREDLDRQRESVDDWAKAMRAKLHAGDICPVCRQTVRCDIPHEEELEHLFLTLEQSWAAADKALNELKDREKAVIAEINLQTRSHTRAEADFIKDTSVAECEKAARNACRLCGFTSIDKDTESRLSRLHDETQASLNGIAGQIAMAETMEKSVAESRKETERLRLLTEQARMELDKVENIINQCHGAINISRTLIRNKTDEIEAAGKEAAALITTSLWENDWTADSQAFRNELISACKIHNDRKAEHQSLLQELREKRLLTDNISETAASILAIIPEWRDAPKSKAKEIPELQKKANDIRTTVKSVTDRIKAATATAKDKESKLTAYLAGNPTVTSARLAELSNYSAAEITATANELARTREDIITKRTVLQQLLSQQKEHSANRPELRAEETTATLAAAVKLIDGQLNAAGERKGAAGLLLQQDEDNRKKLSALLDDAEKKKAAYRQWSRMNQLIGDATGSKFRKIAQSYVLASLIHSANSYMRTLTDRYTLKVEPGTFVIMLEDAYQGFASRAASTLSGGEGFLVSLALALALSDIGQRIAVDTLFIDEGFGTLSGEPLQNAVNTLRTLHTKSGRHVGIISHVDELQERIPVQIQVCQEGNNSSSRISVIP